MTLTDLSLRDLLSAFSSSDPTPGGGSASALASALGASLLMMVAGLPRTRHGSEDDRRPLTAAVDLLNGIRAELTTAIDTDSAAYSEVVAAYKLPKASAGDQVLRTAAIQQALRDATDVPLRVMRLSAAALDQANVIAAHAHTAAASDVGVGIALLHAGLHGAQLNVDINLGSLADAEYTAAVNAEATGLAERAADAIARAASLLRRP